MFIKFKDTPLHYNLTGVFFIVISVLLSTLSNSLIHSLTETINDFQILFLKSFITLLLTVPLILKNPKVILQSPNKRWHFLKILVAFLGTIFWIMSLRQLPLSFCIAFSMTSSIFTTLGSFLFFKESLNVSLIFSLIFGIAGYFFVLNPASHSLNYINFFPLLSAVCFSASSLIIKKVSLKDTEFVSLFYLVFGMALLSAPLAFFNWEFINQQDYLKIILIGILYFIIQWCIIKAYTLAVAGFLAPFKLIRFPLSVFVSLFIFHESVSLSLIFGSLFIIISCLFVSTLRHSSSIFLKHKKF